MTEINKTVKKFLDWNEFEDMMFSLQNMVAGKNFTGVYGLPRGGLVIATVLSNRLNLPMLTAPCKGCIVVDDLSDSGITLRHYADCGYFIATWGCKDRTTVTPDWFFEKFEDYHWIVFPWEGN